MLETALALGGMWLVGWLQKHKTRLGHKTWGPAVNVALGQVAAAAIAGDLSQQTLKDGLVLAAAAELGVANVKAGSRMVKLVKEARQ